MKQIIAKSTLREFLEKHADSEQYLKTWYDTAKSTKCFSPNDENTTPQKIHLSNDTDSLSGLNVLSVAERTDCNVKIFPNPTKGKIKVEIIPNSINNYEIYLTDMQGSILYSQPSTKKVDFEIDITGYSSGTYFLNVIDTKDKNAYSHKIVKE